MIWALMIAAFALGSIPFGVIIAKRHGVDIRTVGSGNPGATNVYRTLGPKAGVPVFVLDALKGGIPAGIAPLIQPTKIGMLDVQTIAFLVGCAAILGHCFSPFLGFKGGKGVATLAGVAIGAAPLVALPAITIFVVLLLTIQYMSLASMLAIWIAVPFCLFVPSQSRQLLVVFTLIAVFVTIMHRSNIRRLLKGEEPRFYFKKRK